MIERIRTRVVPFLRLILPLSLVVVVTACGLFDPKTGGPPPPPPFQYPDLSTPQNVILNLKYAWEKRDSVRTRLLYADDYVGSSTDNDGTVSTFTKPEEVATVWAMGKSQNINRIDFTLKPETTWVRLKYPSDPSDWTAIQLPGVNIQVDDAVLGTQIANSSNFFEFKFRPTLDAASPTDTTWKIVHWQEIRN